MTGSPPRKPLVLITGFLGAGKTTLLRGLVADLSAQGLRADIILNDVANAEFDVATFDQESLHSVAGLGARCACCQSLDELMTLCRNAAQGDGDLLLIELNGTADPLSVIESFSALDGPIPFEPKLVSCVVDVRHWGTRGAWAAIERRQLEVAGLRVHSHTDAVGSDTLGKLDDALREVAPQCQVTTPEKLAQGLALEIHGQRAPVDLPDDAGRRMVDSGSPQSNRRAEDPVHRLSHKIECMRFSLPSKVRRVGIERLLAELPTTVLRAKALVKTVDEPGTRWLFERAGTEVAADPLPAPGFTEFPSSLMCVGVGLESPGIRASIRREFGFDASEL